MKVRRSICAAALLLCASLAATGAAAACAASQDALDGTITQGTDGVRLETARAEGPPVRIPIMGRATLGQRLQGLCIGRDEAEQVRRYPSAYFVYVEYGGTYRVMTRAAAAAFRPASSALTVPR